MSYSYAIEAIVHDRITSKFLKRIEVVCRCMERLAGAHVESTVILNVKDKHVFILFEDFSSKLITKLIRKDLTALLDIDIVKDQLTHFMWIAESYLSMHSESKILPYDQFNPDIHTDSIYLTSYVRNGFSLYNSSIMFKDLVTRPERQLAFA